MDKYRLNKKTNKSQFKPYSIFLTTSESYEVELHDESPQNSHLKEQVFSLPSPETLTLFLWKCFNELYKLFAWQKTT